MDIPEEDQVVPDSSTRGEKEVDKKKGSSFDLALPMVTLVDCSLPNYDVEELSIISQYGFEQRRREQAARATRSTHRVFYAPFDGGNNNNNKNNSAEKEEEEEVESNKGSLNLDTVFGSFLKKIRFTEEILEQLFREQLELLDKSLRDDFDKGEKAHENVLRDLLDVIMDYEEFDPNLAG